MIQPPELKPELPVDLSHGAVATTTQVWNILVASREGNLEMAKELASKCPELVYAQYNYTPPVHLAVREGHVDLVSYLLDQGAHDPDYKIYPFRDSLLTIAQDREYHDIASLLQQYANDPSRWKFKGDNGTIHVPRHTQENDFQDAVDKGDLEKTRQILQDHPAFVQDDSFFWGEGILMMPAKKGHVAMVELLMSFGAKVPDILKWAQQYYFKQYDMAAFLLENGMSPQVMSWHQVTLLHDMAQKGDIPKAALLVKHGADIDLLEDEYQSTPLGMAVRWGHSEMVEYLLRHGANPHKSGAPWSAPLALARKKGYPAVEALLRKAGAK